MKKIIFMLVLLAFVFTACGVDLANKPGVLTIRFEYLGSNSLSEKDNNIVSWRVNSLIETDNDLSLTHADNIVVITDLKKNESYEIKLDTGTKSLKLFQMEGYTLIIIDVWHGNGYKTNRSTPSYVIKYEGGKEPETYKLKKYQHPVFYKNDKLYFYQNDAIYVAKLNEIEQAEKVADIETSMKNDYVIINFICSDEQIEVYYDSLRASKELLNERIREVHVATVELGEA